MTTKILDRQYPLIAVSPVMTKADLGVANGYQFAIPMNALVLRVGLQTTTAFDSGTTATAWVRRTSNRSSFGSRTCFTSAEMSFLSF
jgi:hypothetical protein